jgi:hypothetical protein
LQAKQQQKPQHPSVENVTVKTMIQSRILAQQQQPKSSDSPIEMVDIIKQQAKFEQLVISEIEVQNIELDADYQFVDDALELKQRISDSIQAFDTFRGGTELPYNSSQMIFSESDDRTMDKIMFGAQTAKQSQRKYQDSMNAMKDNPNSGVKRKTQKSVRFQIEEDKVIEGYFEAHVTHWQELETQGRVQQRQEQMSNQITSQYQALDQQCLVWQECDGEVKESKPSTLSPS